MQSFINDSSIIKIKWNVNPRTPKSNRFRASDKAAGFTHCECCGSGTSYPHKSLKKTKEFSSNKFLNVDVKYELKNYVNS